MEFLNRGGMEISSRETQIYGEIRTTDVSEMDNQEEPLPTVLLMTQLQKKSQRAELFVCEGVQRASEHFGTLSTFLPIGPLEWIVGDTVFRG